MTIDHDDPVDVIRHDDGADRQPLGKALVDLTPLGAIDR